MKKDIKVICGVCKVDLVPIQEDLEFFEENEDITVLEKICKDCYEKEALE